MTSSYVERLHPPVLLRVLQGQEIRGYDFSLRTARRRALVTTYIIENAVKVYLQMILRHLLRWLTFPTRLLVFKLSSHGASQQLDHGSINRQVESTLCFGTF